MNTVNVYINFKNDNMPVGELYLPKGAGQHFFRYSPQFLGSGLEISPLHLPLTPATQQTPRQHPHQRKISHFRFSFP